MRLQSFPNALTLVVAFILLAGILTYLIPKGQYDRVLDQQTQRETVVPGSYHKIKAAHLSPFEILLCIPRGVVQASEVLVLIFFVGGCIFIVEKTGALKNGVAFIASKFKGREEVALVLVGLCFAVGGAVEALEEEIVALIPMLLVFSRNLGFPRVVTIGVSFGSAMIGAAFSPINPFGAVIGHKIAGLPFLSGGLFLLGVSVLQFSVWMFLMIKYTRKNKVVVLGESKEKIPNALTSAQTIILGLLAFAFVFVIVGMLLWNWSLNSISAEFFVVAIIVGYLGGFGINETFKLYVEGFKEMVYAAMIVGLAYGIPLVLKEGMIIDTLIYAVFTPLQYLPSLLSAIGMMVSQSLLHVVLPAYSGQAALTIPILAPVSDLIGLSRVVCVMAFQFGAILINMVVPTNGALMAVIAVAGISYDEWFSFVLKRYLVIFILCAGCLAVAIGIGI